MFNLFKTVGNNRENREDDVFVVKDALSDFGYFDFSSNASEPHGIFTRELDDGIKAFQSENGLRVDGVLKPKGETENALRQRFVAERKEPDTGFVFAQKREREFDATGRRIRDEERPDLFSLAKDYRIKPFTEEEVMKKLKERQVRLAAVASQSQSQSAQKQSVPIPQQKPQVQQNKPKHTIDTFFPEVANKEKGYTSGSVNQNAIDRRGATNIGINSGTLTEYQNWKKSRKENLPSSFTTNIKQVQPKLARQIYDEMYYKRYKIDKVDDEQTAGHILDMAILNGPTNAVRWYQQELNAKLGTKMKEDGVLGSGTRKAIETAKQQGVLREVNNAVVRKRIKAFEKQAQHPTQAGFLNGWLDRAKTFILPPIPKEKPF